MKIAIRGGHNYGVPGAKALLDEVTEDRKIYAKVAEYLKQLGHEVLDVTPEKTSTSNEDLSYGVSRANTAKADLFVSCHVNAGGGKGCEVLYYNGSSKGKDYATKVVNSIASLGFNNRGAKADSRRLYELKHTSMPAIIIEPFFLDTQSDVDLYNNIGVDKLAKAIAEGITGQKVPEPKPIQTEKSNNTLYKVQVGAFAGKGNAEKLAAELKSKGYSTIIKEEK